MPHGRVIEKCKAVDLQATHVYIWSQPSLIEGSDWTNGFICKVWMSITRLSHHTIIAIQAVLLQYRYCSSCSDVGRQLLLVKLNWPYIVGTVALHPSHSCFIPVLAAPFVGVDDLKRMKISHDTDLRVSYHDFLRELCWLLCGHLPSVSTFLVLLFLPCAEVHRVFGNVVRKIWQSDINNIQYVWWKTSQLSRTYSRRGFKEGLHLDVFFETFSLSQKSHSISIVVEKVSSNSAVDLKKI